MLDPRFALSLLLLASDRRGPTEPFCLEAEALADTGRGVVAVAWTDLDGDGDSDLIAASETRDRVSVLLNTGNGTFAPKVEIPLPQPVFVAATDLNGDSRPDLVAANLWTAYALLNRGDGSFGTGIPIATNIDPNTVCLADLDGDGTIDLAAARPIAGGGVAIFPNRGDGSFRRGVDHPVGTIRTLVLSLAAADFDGDRRTDLAVGCNHLGQADTITVLHNAGNGVFDAQVLDGVLWPDVLLAGDVNGDGDPDLVYLGTGQRAVFVRLNLGTGSFAPGASYPLEVLPVSVAGADMDSDGAPDLILGTSSSEMHLLRNDGNGSFESLAAFPVGWPPHSIAATDADGDGDVDIAFAGNEHAGAPASVLRNCGTSGVVFCAGDGSGTACPCNNSSPVGAGAGCLDSRGNAAALRARGSARLAHDALTLSGSSLSGDFALLVQGTAREHGGAGSVYGDGLRCTGGGLSRLGIAATVGGTVEFPRTGDPSLSVLGRVLVPGTRTYQLLFRDRASFCTPETFNLSNGVEVLWMP